MSVEELRAVARFVNTLLLEGGDGGTPREKLASVDAAREWLVTRGFLDDADRVDEAALAAARSFREALRAWLWSRVDDDAGAAALADLERHGRDAGLSVVFDEEGQPRLAPAVGGLAALPGRFLVTLAIAAEDGTLSRLRCCEVERCKFTFVDLSKNRSRRWCGPACASIRKSRTYRERKRERLLGGGQQ